MKATYFPFSIGDIDCAAVSAGEGHFNVRAFFANATEDELQPTLARYGIRTDKIATPFNCLLIRHPDALVLVDTGQKATKLVASLRAAGIAPEAVDRLILSHAHPDHTHGALIDDQPTFPNARVIVSRVELADAPNRLKGLPVDAVDAGDDLLDGVSTIAVPGHTPGQIAVKVESAGETLVYTSDVIAHPIHLERPDWNIVSDADRAQALATRAALLGQAAEQGWWLFVYHFPFPGICRIARDGDHWRITEQRAAYIK